MECKEPTVIVNDGKKQENEYIRVKELRNRLYGLKRLFHHEEDYKLVCDIINEICGSEK